MELHARKPHVAPAPVTPEQVEQAVEGRALQGVLATPCGFELEVSQP